MPRKSKVPLEDRINVVKNFMVHFQTNKFPKYTSEVWQRMSNELQGRWTPHDVYTNVREDRLLILTKAREELAIEVLDEHEVSQPQLIDATVNNNRSASNDTSDSDDPTWTPKKTLKRSDGDRKEKKITQFELVLTEKEWISIKPDGTVPYATRDTAILQPKIWTNVISIAFWKQHKTRCAFVYKRANVKAGSVNGSYTIDIYGKCKSVACDNVFRGHGEKQPDNDGITIHVDTRDTRDETHEEVKRPLNGARRKAAAQEMMREGSIVWKRRQARENMEQGDLEPAFLPNGDVLRQAKTEGLHANLNVKPGDSRDLIRTIENISADPDYVDLIQAVGSSPFYVFYSTPAQLDAYKKYLRVNKATSVICVDATGSLVRKLDRPGDAKTGHIFLYSVVVNFEGTTQPVHQMISEKHDTDFIEYWLKQWIRRGAAKPKEAVSDYSRALINALCLAFNNRTIKTYLDICFAIIENTRGVIERPSTIIRIDVAHFIHMICRWSCFEKANQACIKDFFVRCVALMVESTSLKQFERVFTLTCAVGLQTHEDSELALEIPLVKTAKDARYKLEGYIATRQIEQKLKKHKPRDEVDYTAGPFEMETDDDTSKLDDDTKSRNRLLHWVELQKKRGEETVRKGRDVNAFYLPNFIEQLYKLAKEFPLWTGVAVSSGCPHATSSYVEGYFNDMKTRVFTAVKAPARVDIFIKELARDIIGETLLFDSQLTKAEMKQAATTATTKLGQTRRNQAKREEVESRIARDEGERNETEHKQIEKNQAETRADRKQADENNQAERKQVENNQTEREQTKKSRTEREKAEKNQAECEQAEQEEPEKGQVECDQVEKNLDEREEAEKGQAECERAETSRAERKEAECEQAEREETECEQAERGEAECEQAERKEAEREEAEREDAECEHAEQEEAECEQAEQEEAEYEQAEREQNGEVDLQNHQTEVTLNEIYEVQLGCKDSYISQLPHLNINTGELSFVENDSFFLGHPSFTNDTVNDSDLMSTEDWRAKAPLQRSVDDFDGINPSTDLQLHTYASDSSVPKDSSDIGESTDNVYTEYSYLRVEASSSPMKFVEISVEGFEKSVGRDEQWDTREHSNEMLDKHRDSDIRFNLQDNIRSNYNESDLDQTVSIEVKENLLPSSETNGNASVEIQNPVVAKTSKYFRSYPEIRQRNLLTAKAIKPHLLPNGNKCRRGVEIDGDTIFVKNTCPFDSLVHVLMTRAIDDVNYASFIEKSQSDTLKFVSAFMKSGLTPNILRERVKILKNFYAKEIEMKTEKRVLSYKICAWDSIENIVQHTMKSEPSIYKREECSHCGGRTYSYATIAPNHNTICRKGFGALQTALAFKPLVNNLTCQDRCPGKFTLFSEPNVHIFIDLDIRETFDVSVEELRERSTTGLHCKLEDIPQTIDIGIRVKGKRKVNVIAQYSLAGLVAYQPGHFIAYCRRYNGAWEVYNDLKTEIGREKPGTKIEPHLAVYVRQQANET